MVGDIPQETTAFQHRPNLLDTLLDPPSGGRVTVVYAVTGMRGVGKTQLAAACARRRLIQGWRVVAWIAAEDRQQLLAGYEQLAGELGLAEDGQDSAQSAARVRHWLEADGTNCLLVLDNANSADAVRPFLPAAGRSRVIVTSWRQTLASLGTPVPPLLAQNLADRQRILGPDHPDTLTTRNMLAAAYQDTGSPDQAISLVEQNLVDRSDLLGDGECGEARPGAESFQQGADAAPCLRGPEYPTDRRLGDPDDLVRLPDGSAVDTTERVVFRNGDYLDCRLENLEWWDERVRGPVPQPDATRGNDPLPLVTRRSVGQAQLCLSAQA